MAELLRVRTRMMHELQTGLDTSERGFLLSLVAGTPDWDLIGVRHVSQLPAVQWKLMNLEKLRRDNLPKFEEQHARLAERLA